MQYGQQGDEQLLEAHLAELAQRASRELGYAVAERFNSQEEDNEQVAVA